VHVRDDDVAHRVGLDPQRASPSFGARMNSRLRRAATSAVKPVSTTKFRSTPRISHTK
jgi:hypothetical protein